MAPEHLSSRKNSGMPPVPPCSPRYFSTYAHFPPPKSFPGSDISMGPLTNTNHPTCQVDSCSQLSVLRQAERGSPPLCSHAPLKNFTFHSLHLLGLPLPPPTPRTAPRSPVRLLQNLPVSRVGERCFLPLRARIAWPAACRPDLAVADQGFIRPPSPRPTSLAPAPPPRPRRQVLRAPSPGPGQTPRAAGTARRAEGAAAAFRTRGRPGAPARRPGARQAPDRGAGTQPSRSAGPRLRGLS